MLSMQEKAKFVPLEYLEIGHQVTQLERATSRYVVCEMCPLQDSSRTASDYVAALLLTNMVTVKR